MTTDRRSILKEMSAADLRAELIARLRDEIRRHEQEIERINNQIRQLQPTETVVIRRAIRNPRGIARNDMPLRQVIARVLRENGQPMSISEIVDGVKAWGYQSNATNFRGVINMTLSNAQLFEKVGRGVYTLRPDAVLEESADENTSEQSELTVAAGVTDDSSSSI